MAGSASWYVRGFPIGGTGTVVVTDPTIKGNGTVVSPLGINFTTPWSANWDAGSHKLSDLAAPVAGADATNKTYVDNAIAAAIVSAQDKAPVQCALTSPVANLLSVPVAQPGYTIVATDRVGIIGGASPDGVAPVSLAYNGIYTAGPVVAGLTTLTRSSDANTAALIAGALFAVEKGAQADSLYFLPLKPSDITLNTTPLPFVDLANSAISRTGTADNRPAASSVQPGTLYYATDQGITYRSDGVSTWTILANPGLVRQTFTVNSGTGSDSNVGTAANPFATLAKALSVVSPTPFFQPSILLQGAGPYTAPAISYGAPIPQGPNGAPIIVVGDSYVPAGGGAAITGAVTNVSGAVLTTNIAGLTADQMRALLVHNTTSGKTAKYNQIATHTTSPNAAFTSIGNAWSGWSIGDTIELLQPQTQISTYWHVAGAGPIVLWRIAFTGTAGFTAEENGQVWFDACTFSGTRPMFGETGGHFFGNGLFYSDAWSGLSTTYGTQDGATCLGILASTARCQLFSASQFDGFFISKTSDANSAFSLNTGRCRASFLGLDIINTSANGGGVGVGIGSYAETNGGWGRIALGGGASAIGLSMGTGSSGSWSSVVTTGAGNAAVSCSGGQWALLGLAGSTGNGLGLLITGAGEVSAIGCGVTGSAGDVKIDSDAAVSWTVAGQPGPIISLAIRRDGKLPFTADQPFGAHKATGVADPTLAQDAATKNYVDTTTVPSSSTIQGTAPVTVNGDNGAHAVTGSLTVAIVTATDSVTGAMSAADHASLTELINDAVPETKLVVRAASTQNLAATRTGNVLTATGLVVLTKVLIDTGWVTGPALAVNDRLLLDAQTTSVDNGIYVVTSLGLLGVTAWSLTRAPDMNASSQIQNGMTVPVAEGTSANRRWQLVVPADPPPVLNTDVMTFQLAATADISAATPQLVGGTGAAGTSNKVSAGDHSHEIGFGSDAQGDLPIRGAAHYQRLAAGTSGQSLLTGGAGANPAWDYPTQIGKSATINAYVGGTGAADTAQGANFTASNIVSVYRITATGVTVTLDSGDADGTVYEFWNTTKSATPNFSLTPNGGLKVNIAGSYDQTTVNINADFIARSVSKRNGAWWIAS